MLHPTGKTQAYLELIRVPNLFTAPGNVIAGYLLTNRGIGIEWTVLISLAIASVLLYAGGVVLNDYFDRDLDAVERPERPLPSGRIIPRAALMLGVRLLAIGCVITVAVGATSLIVGALLTGCIVLYDARAKRIPYVGGVTMGMCRFLNVALGASGAFVLPLENWLWFTVPAASLVLLYIAAVTVLSTGEVWGGNRVVASATFSALVVVLGGVVWLGVSDRLKSDAYLPFLVVFGMATLYVVGRVVIDPGALNIRRAIKVCILSLPLLDAAIAAGAAGLPYGLLVAAFLLPALYISKLFAVT